MEKEDLEDCVVIIYGTKAGETIIPFREIKRIDSYNGEEKTVVVNIKIEGDYSGHIIGTHYEILTIEELKKRNKE